MMPSLRDQLARFLPSWLGDNYPDGPSFGFRMLSCMALLVELGIDTAIDGSAAALARGTPTALPYLGQARGLLRWQNESDAEYAARLRGWLDAVKESGSERALAKQIHGYLSSRPKVEIISRSGRVIACAADGTLTSSTTAWNWDSASNPERAGCWADLFVIVYSTQFSDAGVWGNDGQTWGSAGAMGDTNTAEEFDSVVQLCGSWQSAHAKIRALIVNKNGTRPAPNGNWGEWRSQPYLPITPAAVPSSRDTINNFFWEF